MDIIYIICGWVSLFAGFIILFVAWEKGKFEFGNILLGLSVIISAVHSLLTSWGKL